MASVRLLFGVGVLVGSLSTTGCSGDGGEGSGPNDASGSLGSGGTGSGSTGSGGSGSEGAATTGAANRTVLSCAALETKIEADAAALDLPTEVTLDEWEGVPAELKLLPEGAELCGSIDILNQGLIKSELGGAALEQYYRPIFAGLDCPALECNVQTDGDQEQYACSCFGDDHYGSLTTAPDVAYYLLSYE